MHPSTASGTYTEREIKLAVADVAATLAALQALGFVAPEGRQFESNRLYDYPGASLRGKGELLRLRTIGQTHILTFKGKATTGRHKEREELEISLQSAEIAGQILERMGLAPGFRYEKYRTTLQRPGESGLVVVDETPIGNYMELEGEADWIDRTALQLGYREADYLQSSYGKLYLEHCQRAGVTPADMVLPL